MKAIRRVGKTNPIRHWYGYSQNGEIGVNLELLWKEFPDDDKFIKEFASTYAHEKLHCEIELVLSDLFRFREEDIIRRALKERWNNKIKKLYR